MRLSHRVPRSTQMPSWRHQSVAAAVVILAIGCRDDVSPANQAMGADVRPAPQLARASSAALAFTSYQIVSTQFTMLSGQNSAVAEVYCPSGTYVTGGGVSSLPSGILDYSVTDTYPGYNSALGLYLWDVGVLRAPTSDGGARTLTGRAVCVS